VNDGVHEARSRKVRIRRSASFLSGAQILKRACRMAVLVVAARVLGPTVFGQYALLLTITELMAVISGAGYIDLITREMAARPERCSGLASQLSILRALYLCIVLALACGILKGLHYPDTFVVAVALMSLALLPRVIAESSQGLLRGASYFHVMPIIEIAQGLALLGAGTMLVLVHRSMNAMIAAEIIASSAGAICSLWFVRPLWDFHQPLVGSFTHLVKRASPFNVYPFIVNVYDRADVMVLSKLAGDASVGIYSMAYRGMASLQILPSALMGALLPRLSAAGWNADKHEDCSRSMRFLYVVSLTVILGTMLFADTAVEIVLGPAYRQSALALRLLIWALIPMFLNSALNTTLLATGREKVFVVTASVCTAFNLLMNILFIPHYSFRAAAVITVTTELLLLSQNLWFVRRTLGRIPPLRRVVVPSLVFVLSILLWIAGRNSAHLWLSSTIMILFGTYIVIDTRNWMKAIRLEGSLVSRT
jgi:O-antigen/teichoic acid export membrane protein